MAKTDDLAQAADQFYVEVGRRVRVARGSRTQAQLAAALGMTRSSVANLEAGRQRIPLHIFILATRALGVPIGDLLPRFDTETDPSLLLINIEDAPESTQDFIQGAIAQLRLPRNVEGS